MAIYGRISTSDKGQTIETQVLPLRQFVVDQGWTTVGEFCDEAPATDMRARSAWRQVLGLASRRRIDLVLVFRIDRAFRSVLDAATTLERLRGWGVGLRSYCEPWLDTTSPFGEALYFITCAYAQLERGILAERVKAGMERARKQGRRLGRPGGTQADDFEARWIAVRPKVLGGEVSRRRAAVMLNVSPSTLRRLLAVPGDARSSEMALPPVHRDAGAAGPGEKVLQTAALGTR